MYPLVLRAFYYINKVEKDQSIVSFNLSPNPAYIARDVSFGCHLTPFPSVNFLCDIP